MVIAPLIFKKALARKIFRNLKVKSIFPLKFSWAILRLGLLSVNFYHAPKNFHIAIHYILLSNHI